MEEEPQNSAAHAAEPSGHTPQESAIRLLETFNQSGCDPLEFMRSHVFGYTFSIEGWTPADFDAGLAHAVEQGWIMKGRENLICATEEGLAQVGD